MPWVTSMFTRMPSALLVEEKVWTYKKIGVILSVLPSECIGMNNSIKTCLSNMKV